MSTRVLGADPQQSLTALEGLTMHTFRISRLTMGILAVLAVTPATAPFAQGGSATEGARLGETAPPTATEIIASAKAKEAAAAKAIADAQAETKKEQERWRELEKNFETLRFGLSLGWRHNVSESIVRDVAINPANNFVVVDSIDRGAFILSGVIAAHPWRNQKLLAADNAPKPKNLVQHVTTNLWRLGFIVNVNVAEFSPDNVKTFNRSLEGGIGATWKLNEEFAFAATTERMFGRRLRSFVKPNEPLLGSDGKALTSLSIDDNTYFRDDNMTTMSFKFVYYIK